MSYELDNVPVTVIGSSLTIDTPKISLTKGTYWLSVVPNLSDPGTFWYWFKNSSPTPQGYLPVWRGFPDDCVGLGQDWSRFINGPSCPLAYPNAGLMFIILARAADTPNESEDVYRYPRYEARRISVGSTLTLMHAATPEANARSSAGRICDGSVTASP